jgi:hypothetical protein
VTEVPNDSTSSDDTVEQIAMAAEEADAVAGLPLAEAATRLDDLHSVLQTALSDLDRA